ncbi:helix-turn-helix domain-containing protein [Rhizobium sp. ICMP 5592]|nr:helix-turn-helix domain-containing protein [Rhizobium sp. ICMP 5592]MQB45979.1 helix-turn-helix domain-containing protein [Rhizobium sp. ICMP 5592]
MEQRRGARAMLGWSQAELAKAAHVSRQTVADFERGTHIPIGNNLASMVAAFQEVGIEFIRENGGGAGVRFKKPMSLGTGRRWVPSGGSV